MARHVRFSAFRPGDVEAMYSKRGSIRGGVSAAEPDMSAPETVRLPTGKIGQPWSHHDVQSPEDQHAENYDNDVADDWRRGAGDGLSDATSRPGFDHSPPRDKMRR